MKFKILIGLTIGYVLILWVSDLGETFGKISSAQKEKQDRIEKILKGE